MRMVFFVILVGLFILSAELTSSEPNYRKYDTSVITAQLEKGRNELERIENFVSRSRLPRTGECWKSALDNLRVSCSQLSEEVHSRLAISFASCFSEMSGLPNYSCSPNEKVKDCILAMDDQGVHSYREFFLHTLDMCHYMQSVVWQEETDRAVNTLQLAAVEMSKTVSEQKITADSILAAQQEALKVQGDMLYENNVIFETVLKIKDAFQDFSVLAAEHRGLFTEMFQKLARMQELVAWIQGEMSLIDFIGFYLMAMLFSYFATSTERTQKARVWIVFNLALSILLERLAFWWMSSNTSNSTPEDILAALWIIRKCVAAMSIAFLIYAAARYRDYDALNNTILLDLQDRMKIFLDSFESHTATMRTISLEDSLANVSNGWAPPKLELEDDLAEAELTTETDTTFSGTDEDFNSPRRPNRDKTANNVGYVSRMGFLKSLFRSVIRASKVKSVPTSDDVGSGSDESYPGDVELSNQILSPEPQRKYNLRERKPVVHNPQVELETPTQFVKKIKAARKSRLIKYPIKDAAPTANYFSADEEDGM